MFEQISQQNTQFLLEVFSTIFFNLKSFKIKKKFYFTKIRYKIELFSIILTEFANK